MHPFIYSMLYILAVCVLGREKEGALVHTHMAVSCQRLSISANLSNPFVFNAGFLTKAVAPHSSRKAGQVSPQVFLRPPSQH